MPLTPDEVSKVARLARLQLTANEREQFRGQLEQILDYIHILDQVDTESIEPMAHAADITDVLRADVPAESLPRVTALQNAPATDGKYFLVPPILDGGT